MKVYFIFIAFIFCALPMVGQIDNSNKTLTIDQNNDIDLGKYSLSTKKGTTKNNFTLYDKPRELKGLQPEKKPFSMNLDNGLLGPERKLTPKSFKTISKEKESSEELKSKEYYGDHKTKSQFIYLYFRDYGAIDGDYVSLALNDFQILQGTMLRYDFKKIKVDLVKGFNKIDINALNQGEVGGNTAQFEVYDDQGVRIIGDAWSLATGGKASFILVKE